MADPGRVFLPTQDPYYTPAHQYSVGGSPAVGQKPAGFSTLPRAAPVSRSRRANPSAAATIFRVQERKLFNLDTYKNDLEVSSTYESKLTDFDLN